MPDIKFSNKYPYTDFHELNLDWVIKEVKYWSTKVGKTIQSIELTGTAGLVDTYTITYSDDTTSTFDVTNGNGIASVAKTGTVGLVDTYTITFQDGNTTTFEVTNGATAVDPTLTLQDYAADAKATGDIINAYAQTYKVTGFTMNVGQAVNTSNNNIITSPFWSYSDYIECNDIVSIYARMSANLGIAYYDINKGYISGQAPAVATTAIFILQKPANAHFIRFNNASNDVPNSQIVITAVKAVIDTFGESDHPMTQKAITNAVSKNFTGVSFTTDKYISTTTGVMTNVPYGQHAFASDYIEVDEINAIYTSFKTVYGMAYYDTNHTFIVGLNPNTDETPQWVILDPPADAKYVRFSCYGENNSFVQCRLFYGIAGNVKSDKIEQERPYINITGMYDKSIHIGDSLTYSQVWLSNNLQRQAFIPYPEAFGNLADTSVSVLAFSGATPVTWWNTYSGNLTEHGLYIVFLGTNGGLTDTIATDCPSSDISDFANTNTGCYGKILQTITDNGDKAVLIRVFHELTNASVTNDVIEQFGTRYNFPVIDIDTVDRMNEYYHLNPADTSYSNSLHFNDLGYTWLANIIFNKINALAIEDKFKLSRTQ